MTFRCLLLLIFTSTHAHAQWWNSFDELWTYDDIAVVNPWEDGTSELPPSNKFTFARLRYTSQHRGYAWFTDYPDSDINFSTRLGELTTVEVNRDDRGRIIHAVIDIMDPRLFHFPFVYMVEVGNLKLSEAEGQRLREYLLRGGFLMIDDFWSDREWYNWLDQLSLIFPDEKDYPLVPIPKDHAIFDGVFHVTEVPQVPSIHAWTNYRADSDRPGEVASANGIFDKSGRLLMVVMHNTDLGDGWEKEGADPEYFQRFSVNRAYPFGINVVVYAMTR